MNLGENCNGHICVSPEAGEGYRFSKAMHNPAFISVDDIRNIYMPMGVYAFFSLVCLNIIFITPVFARANMRTDAMSAPPTVLTPKGIT